MAFTEGQKRELIEQVAWKMFCGDAVGLKLQFAQNWWKNNPEPMKRHSASVENVLNAANHFKLREVIEQYIKYLRNTAKEYRDEASVWCWHDTAKNLDTIASDLESMLKGRWGRVSEWIAWVLMAGGLYFVVIGLANVNKRQPFALVMVLCGVLLAFAANVVAELVSK